MWHRPVPNRRILPMWLEIVRPYRNSRSIWKYTLGNLVSWWMRHSHLLIDCWSRRFRYESAQRYETRDVMTLFETIFTVHFQKAKIRRGLSVWTRARINSNRSFKKQNIPSLFRNEYSAESYVKLSARPYKISVYFVQYHCSQALRTLELRK